MSANKTGSDGSPPDHGDPLTEIGYRRLVRAVTDYAIFMLSPDGIISSWNTGAQRISGYAAEEVIGKHVSMFFTEEDRAAGRSQHALAIAAATGRFEGDGWRVRKDGSRFWASAAVDALHNDDGKLIGFAKITRDLTEQRKAHPRLLESERHFRLLVDGVRDYAIFTLDLNGTVTTWNSGAQHIKGYTAEEAIGLHFSQFYTDEDRLAGLPQKGLLAARANNRHESEGWRVRKDGTRFWASVVISAIRDEHGELIGFAKVTRDITERKEVQEALEAAREQLFQAQKLEAIGQLTGGVAHDFNNLLAAVLSGLALIERRAPDEAQLGRVIATMRQAIGRGRDLIQQLLTFARRQPVNPVPIEVGSRIGTTFGLLERLIGGNIRVITDFPPGLWPIRVDPNQFDLAVLNVCLNARDAMPDGGTLTISARNVADCDLGDGKRDCVAITIKDTGVGIPRQVLPHIFEPFFTTKEIGKGSGLGLSQAYGFAQVSEGAIGVESEEGRGTAVTFRLPAADHSAGAAAAPRREVRGHRGNVLLVEDELALADLTSALLEDCGFRVTIAHSANAAMTILKRGTPIDVVFSDVVMPGGTSGVDLATAIHEDFPGLPVVLTSGFSDATAQAAEKSIEVVAKPYDPDRLSSLLARRIAEAHTGA